VTLHISHNFSPRQQLYDMASPAPGQLLHACSHEQICGWAVTYTLYPCRPWLTSSRVSIRKEKSNFGGLIKALRRDKYMKWHSCVQPAGQPVVTVQVALLHCCPSCCLTLHTNAQQPTPAQNPKKKIRQATHASSPGTLCQAAVCCNTFKLKCYTQYHETQRSQTLEAPFFRRCCVSVLQRRGTSTHCDRVAELQCGVSCTHGVPLCALGHL
jgi:hypothetical protein